MYLYITYDCDSWYVVSSSNLFIILHFHMNIDATDTSTTFFIRELACI